MTHECKYPQRPEEALELELQAAYEPPNVALGTELWSPGRSSALDCSPAPYFVCAYVNTWAHGVQREWWSPLI